MLNNKKNEKAAVAQKIFDFENWQSNASRSTSERQSGTRRQLKLEPITLYESMCFTSTEDVQKSPRSDQVDDCDMQKSAQREQVDTHDSNSIDSNSESISHPEKNKANEVSQRMTPRKAINNNNNKRNTGVERSSIDMTSETESGQTSIKKPIKQFLKKGDGLKQRFKVDPNAYKLDNLPKYKYSGAHPHLRSKEMVKPLKLQKDSQSTPSSAAPSSAKSNSQKVTEQLDQEKSKGSSDIKETQEKQFQNSLMFSKNVCSSTPDTKSSGYASTEPKQIQNFLQTVIGNQKTLKLQISNGNASLQQPLRHQKVQYATDPGEVPPPSTTDEEEQNEDEIEKSAEANVEGGSTTLSFSHEVNQTQDELDTLNMFEYLEQKVKENNLDVDSSFINRLWKKAANMDKPQSSYDELDEESTDVKDSVSQKGTESSIHTESNSDFYTTDDDGNTSAADKGDHDRSADTEAESSICLSNIVSVRSEDKNLDNVSTAGDAARDQSTNSEFTEVGKNKDNTVLEHFREVLFNLLNQRATQAENELQEQEVSDHVTVKVNPDPHMVGGENNSISFESVHLPEDLNNVKIRNDELEHEVTNFKEANKKLTKMKQVFELEKSMFEQERQDTLKEMHDLKIKFEMYMHDERVKLEEEKRKMEQQLRTQRLTKQNKDRIAVLQLKDEVEKLNMQLRQKEQNHTAAQARLRAQIAKLERDQKLMLDEMEQLKKENKRLEAECMRIEREKNHKLLDEINKNIAKLAPKLVLNDASGSSPAVAQNSSDIIDKIKGPSVKRVFMKHRRVKSPDFKKTKVKCLGPPINTPICTPSSEDEKQNTLKENCSPEANRQQTVPESGTAPKEYADKMSHVCPTTLCRSTSTTGIQKPLEEKKEDKKSVSASTSTEFNREIVNADGSKDIWYSNGNIKKLSADRMHIKMLYFNKDIKETDIEKGTIRYYYASTNTWHTTYLDGLEILEFPNGQTEHRLKNGVIETHFPNHSIKIVDPHNKEVESEWHFEDGTKLKHMQNGDKILILSNGQREIHTKMCKRREYPDGTVKIVYPDGSQETRYSNGRVRLKDRDGKLIMDSDNAVRY